MSDWGTAVIAAGSAILGSITTGFFAWKAGHRQAAAAETAGQAQAAALISTVQATLDEQRRARSAEQRRQTYAQMLVAGTSRGNEAMRQALAQVELEGPPEVTEAAISYRDAVVHMDEVWQDEAGADLDAARAVFIRVARSAVKNV